MNAKEKSPIKGYVLSGVIILLVIVSILITQRLFTAEYPTHSDVFFYGSGMWCACDGAFGLFIFGLSTSISFSGQELLRAHLILTNCSFFILL